MRNDIIINEAAFTPEETKLLVSAFEGTLDALHLADRQDPLTLRVAETVLKFARQGERDPARVQARVLAELRQ